MKNNSPNNKTSFILDESLKNLNNSVEELIFQIKNPLAGERINTLKKFTNELVKAYCNQTRMKITRKPPKESLIITTEQQVQNIPQIQIIPSLKQPYKMPSYPTIPSKQKIYLEKTNTSPRRFALAEESLKITLPTQISTKSEQETLQLKKLTPQKKEIIETPQQKTEELKEKKINLIISKISGEVLAHAIQKGVIYTIYEKELSEGDVQILNSIKPLIETKKELLKEGPKLQKLIKKQAKKNKVPLDLIDNSKLRYFLIKHIVNFGLIDPLFQDSKITKVICEGPNLKIKIVRDDEELITNLEYRNQKKLDLFLKKVANKTKQNITEDEPLMEAEIENFRIKATMGTENIPSKFVMERLI